MFANVSPAPAPAPAPAPQVLDSSPAQIVRLRSPSPMSGGGLYLQLFAVSPEDQPMVFMYVRDVLHELFNSGDLPRPVPVNGQVTFTGTCRSTIAYGKCMVSAQDMLDQGVVICVYRCHDDATISGLVYDCVRSKFHKLAEAETV
jgi:hypothetical protein